MFTYLAMALMTLGSMWLIDRVGRRPLWMVASVLMAVITAVTGVVFHFEVHGPLVLLVLVLCTVPHGLALGGLPWLMMSELFPTRIRAQAVAVTTTFLWIAIYTSGQFFPMIMGWSQTYLGSSAGVFWVFTVVCLFATLFGWRMLPETKGRTFLAQTLTVFTRFGWRARSLGKVHSWYTWKVFPSAAGAMKTTVVESKTGSSAEEPPLQPLQTRNPHGEMS
jgi:MFS family permease